MLQIKSEAVIGTAVLVAAFAGGLGNGTPEHALRDRKFNLIVCDESTAPTSGSSMTAKITTAHAGDNEFISMLGVALASREIKIPADVAAIISRDFHKYWD